jgi:hypothetical protein
MEKQYSENTDFTARERILLRQIPVGYSNSSYEYQDHYHGIKRPGLGADCPHHLVPELEQSREINLISAVSFWHIKGKVLLFSYENAWLLRRRGVLTCRREHEFVEIVIIFTLMSNKVFLP